MSEKKGDTNQEEEYGDFFSPVFFEENSSDLNLFEENNLDSMSVLLNDNRHIMLEIWGHSNIDEENVKILALQRANAVKEYFEKKNISSLRLIVVDWGSSKMIVDCKKIKCSTEERGLNRRVELVVKPSRANPMELHKND